MKREAAVALSTVAVSLFLLLPEIAQATQSSQPEQNVTAPLAGKHEAMLMVPAQATLTDNLDAGKMQIGQKFRVKLGETIHLKNGSELPHGTILIGTIDTDHMQVNGRSKLALRFTQAELKNGKVIPIKATIVGVFPPDPGFNVGYDNRAANTWNDEVLQIVQPDVLSGVDLHSNVASSNSGVFVSTKKDDMKLRVGTVIELAIAADEAGAQNANGTSSN
jgi:hypothetical protein